MVKHVLALLFLLAMPLVALTQQPPYAWVEPVEGATYYLWWVMTPNPDETFVYRAEEPLCEFTMLPPEVYIFAQGCNDDGCGPLKLYTPSTGDCDNNGGVGVSDILCTDFNSIRDFARLVKGWGRETELVRDSIRRYKQ